MENKMHTFYDILMWGLVLVTIGYAGHVYRVLGTAMQAL